MDKINMKTYMSTCHIYAHTYIYCLYFEFQRLYIPFCVPILSQGLHKYLPTTKHTYLEKVRYPTTPPWIWFTLVSFSIQIYERTCNTNRSTCTQLSGKRGPIFSNIFLHFPFFYKLYLIDHN